MLSPHAEERELEAPPGRYLSACVSHDVAWCSPTMIAVAISPCAMGAVATGGGPPPPPPGDNAIIFPLPFLLGAS